jgi:phage gp29-like protein
MQMCEAKSFGTAAHHLIWNPDSSRLIKLPSGKSVPSLTAKFEYVPMEFFESRTGELRFLGMTQGYTGEPLAPTAWLITNEESPLMFAASILAYYDKLATSDLINFSEKFGTPGIIVHTTASKGTPEGDSAKSLAQSLGSNYRGTQYSSTENKVEIVWPSGGAAGKDLPMQVQMEDIKRDIASLYLGADLSTQSRGGTEKSIGASVQQEGEERRERADCAWISETLNAGVDVIVLRWYFGDDSPILARVSIDAPKNEDRTILSNLVAETVGLGAQVPIEPVMKRLNIPVAKEGDKDVFKAPAVAETPIPGGSTIATNVRGKLPPPSAKRLGEILAIEDDTEFAIALRSEFKTPEISK